MKKIMELGGIWNGEAKELGTFQVKLPGTLDTNGIGNDDEKELRTRLTRCHTYEGTVKYSRSLELPQTEEGKRLFLRIERSRELQLLVDNELRAAYEEGTLSTPWLYELTDCAGKTVELVLLVDNYYTEWPRDSVIGASAATDETQTNWNGVLGDFALYKEEKSFISSLRVYPRENTLDIALELDGADGTRQDTSIQGADGIRKGEQIQTNGNNLKICLYSEALPGGMAVFPEGEWYSSVYEEERQQLKIALKNIPYEEDCLKWDEGEGNLYSIRAEIYRETDVTPETRTLVKEKTENVIKENSKRDVQRICAAETTFGIRTFSADEERRLTLNGRRFFLRGEANCCVFPEEGHPPVTEEQWKSVLEQYEAYGVNCMRFHSWCPPEAAFLAADKMGMMMQPELSQWNFKDAFKDDAARTYYTKELAAVQKELANHPSFVMLTFGNELQYTEEGYVYAEQLLKMAKQYDNTRLYANSSNYHYGEVGTDPGSDFYTSMAYYKEMLRATSSPMIGHLNESYPSAAHDYREAVSKVHKDGKPVFEFEVGQYEVLPDFSEIEKFRGVTRAVNLELVKKAAEEKGMLPEWEKYVEATGELALLCYREETEAALRTEGISGLSLLGLQDFPGQGTALVGMMNSHLEPKPYSFASPERFRKFFAPVLPLLRMDRYTYEAGETVTAEVLLANYGKEAVRGKIKWTLLEISQKRPVKEGTGETGIYEAGKLWTVGRIEFALPDAETSGRYELVVSIGEYENSYPVWAYKKMECTALDRDSVLRGADDAAVQPEDRETGKLHGVMAATRFTEKLLEFVMSGGTAFLEPEPVKENFPQSVQNRFTTDFWSVGTFPEQEGTMGLLIEKEHPVFEDFPTESYSEYQWWQMSQGRAVILPEKIHPVVTVMDSYSTLRHMGCLFEAAVGKGTVMISSMGLLENQKYPECRALLHGILRYLEGGNIQKVQTPGRLAEEELKAIVTLQEVQPAEATSCGGAE